jgi:hypothetical protein
MSSFRRIRRLKPPLHKVVKSENNFHLCTIKKLIYTNCFYLEINFNFEQNFKRMYFF